MGRWARPSTTSSRTSSSCASPRRRPRHARDRNSDGGLEFYYPMKLPPLLLAAIASSAVAIPADELHHRVKIEGHGERTVILESGLGDTLDVWKQVQPEIATGCTRTVAYNRAGYDGSDPALGPRDAATIVGELRAELKRRNLLPPYVLVGHSLGGL